MDDKFKQLMRKELITYLQPIVSNTSTTHFGVHVQQLKPQSSLVTNLTSVNQQLGWQQPITSLIIGQPKVVPYPPYPMWYNSIPSFVPMDHNMYLMYYSKIKGSYPFIFGKKEIM